MVSCTRGAYTISQQGTSRIYAFLLLLLSWLETPNASLIQVHASIGESRLQGFWPAPNCDKTTHWKTSVRGVSLVVDLQLPRMPRINSSSFREILR
jgi:hypothetical protein